MQTQIRLTAGRPAGLSSGRSPAPHPSQGALRRFTRGEFPRTEATRTAALFVEHRSLSTDAASDTAKSNLAESLRRTRPEVEKLLVANRVPPLEAYELLLAALGIVPESLEGADLDRLLIQEVRKSLSTRREQDKLRMEQGRSWIDLLVKAGIVLKADRATWLRTIGAHQR